MKNIKIAFLQLMPTGMGRRYINIPRYIPAISEMKAGWILMLKGAELLLVPNACPKEINRISQLRSRAYENMLDIATPAKYGALVEEKTTYPFIREDYRR